MFQADIFIWLLGNRFELPCNPKRPWKHKNIFVLVLPLQRPSATQVSQHIHSRGTQVQEVNAERFSRGVPPNQYLRSSLWLCQSTRNTPRWWRTGGWARSRKRRWGLWRGFWRCASVRLGSCSSADACRSKRRKHKERELKRTYLNIVNDSTVTLLQTSNPFI